MLKHPANSRWAAVLALAFLASHGTAVAQRPAVSVSAGSATDERGGRWTAATLAPSFPLIGTPHLDVTLGASATQFASHGWQVGSSLAAAARTREINRTALSFNAGSGVTHSSFGSTFVVAEATPAVEFRLGDVTMFGGGRVAAARVSVPVVTSATAARPAGNAVTNRSSVAPVYGAVWLIGRPASQVSASLSFRGEHARVEGERVVDHTGAAAVGMGPVTFGGSYGERASLTERARFATGTVSIGLSRNVTLEGAAGQYPSNRLTGTSPGRFVSAGFTFRFAGAGGPAPLPAPRGVRGPAPGLTRFAIKATDAQSVELYGDWNDWSPVPARRAPNGVWYVDLSLAPGEYRYAFRINEVAWRVPEGVVTTRDGFGGRSAWVTVPRSSTQVGSTSREER